MELEIGENLAHLLLASPWVGLALVILWPDKGVVALWIKRSEAVKKAELERDAMRSTITVENGKGSRQQQLPPPIGEQPALPPSGGEE